MTMFERDFIERVESVIGSKPFSTAHTIADAIINEFIRLNKRVQELEQERRWIPVSERLPEMHEIVLVVSGGVTTARRKIDIIRGYCWVEIDNMELGGVTHWQPLPQPPQEGE